jgi:HEAT repeat protein
VDLLKDNDMFVSWTSVEALAKLSEQGNISVQSGVVSLTSIAAEFRESIRPSIPQIVDLLKHSDNFVPSAGVEALAKFSEQGNISVQSDVASLTSIAAEFQESIRASIPQIVKFFKHNDNSVRSVGAKALAKLSEQGNISVQSGVASLKSIAAEFRESI